MRKMNMNLKMFSFVFVAFFVGVGFNSAPNHEKYFEISKNIEIFTNLYKEINTYYVDDVDPAKLMRTGVDAMLESLDPYTNYISESEIEGFRYITEGKYNGIGALFRKIDGKIMITEPWEGQPAQKAGLKAGDVITEIDGKSTSGKSTEDVSNILKGYPGTEVVMTIQRYGESKTRKVTLVRDEVSVPNVPYSGMIADGIGYVALTTFTRNAGKNVGDAVKQLKEENPDMKGVVFDLRGNGGGLLTEAVNVSNVFIPKNELVVTTKGKVKDWDRSFKTLNRAVDEEIPLVVLINNGSASASEIVSGVMQDMDRGVLMGQRSYGKGLVQNTRDVGYNSKVKLTTAKYYIPSGRCIQSVKYDGGEPLDIPDAERTPFKTKAGRKVLDGGGVKPDVAIGEDDQERIIKSLKGKHLIFQFVTEYVSTISTMDDVSEFKFNDFDKFVQFLADKNYSYESASEKLLKDLMKKAKEEKYKLDSELDVISNKITEVKKNDIMKHEKVLTNLIEKEIAARYEYNKGKIKMGLRNDEEIKSAVELLNDRAKYDSLLK